MALRSRNETTGPGRVPGRRTHLSSRTRLRAPSAARTGRRGAATAAAAVSRRRADALLARPAAVARALGAKVSVPAAPTIPAAPPAGARPSGGLPTPPAAARRPALSASAVARSAVSSLASALTAPTLSGPRAPASPAPVPRPPAGPSTLPGAAPLGVRQRGAGGLQRVWAAARERVPVWVQVRCGMEPRTLGALAAVLVVSAGFAFHHFLSGRPEAVRVPEKPGTAGTTGTVAAPRPGAPLPQPSTGPAPVPGPGQLPQAAGGAVVVVDVSGKVRRPGVLRLPAGSRVADALRAAGGVKAGTAVEDLNRARVLTDGEHVVVGAPAPPPPQSAGGTAAGPGGRPPGVPVSLNSATVEQLDTLPGVGPVLAQHIIDYRIQHGGFRSVEELREVNGIGDPSCQC